ncbi:hypothetical protein M405DRAFT_868704 [Rhizopogon salebrosus TDB-379]|nr:hypothetical protein M405DRAFT_868704 [Rhizopogon salebrosus TDB-379]
MKEKLQSAEFHTRIAAYIDSNIHAHHDDITEQALSTLPREKAVSYARPLDPRKQQFRSTRDAVECTERPVTMQKTSSISIIQRRMDRIWWRMGTEEILSLSQ